MLDTTSAASETNDADDTEILGGERGPIRTCVGCRTRALKDELLRLAIVPADLRGSGPSIIVDVSRKVGGRGLHVHPTLACVRAAVERGGIARAIKGAPAITTQALAQAITLRLEERIDGLLSGARRARRLAIGTDAASAAIDAGKAAALLVAADAAGRSSDLSERVRSRGGEVAVFRDKLRLGALVRGGGRVTASGEALGVEVGVVAILDPGIAAEVVRTLGRVAQVSEAR